MERHLLPNEIDLLVDGEMGFNVAPLRDHAATCADCQARVAEGRIVVEALERLTHLPPSHMFAERVMQRVEVFVPWHVSARDTVRRLVPKSRPARAIAAVMAGSVAIVLTLGTVWMFANADLLVVGFDLLGQRLRAGTISMLGSVLGTLFGPATFEALRAAGPLALVAATGTLLAVAMGVAVGMRFVVGAASRRRS